jgi:hypothetical protein
MSNLLQLFNNDTETKEQVYAYLIDFLEQEAVKKVFEKAEFDEIAAIGSAKEVIEKAFENLDVLFAKKVAKKDLENEAR